MQILWKFLLKKENSRDHIVYLEYSGNLRRFFLKQKTDSSKSLNDKVVNNLNDPFDNVLRGAYFKCLLA